MITHKFIIADSDKHKRLDIYLVEHWDEIENVEKVSRNLIQHLIENKFVRICEKAVKPHNRVRSGDVIEISFSPEQLHRGMLSLTPEDIPLNILYEDADIIVIDKPSGMVVHPAKGNYSGTLVNALLYHCKELYSSYANRTPNTEHRTPDEECRPGIVHRLDKDTSGVMVAAKKDAVQKHLAKQFQDRTVKKRYAALVEGIIGQGQGRIDVPVGRDHFDRKRMSVRYTHAKEAVTDWTVEKELSDIAGNKFSLLKLEPYTGRTHQLRVHLAHIGHPILFDPIYGKKSSHQYNLPGTKRLALHSEYLRICHPATGKIMEFRAEMPEDMSGWIGECSVK